MVDLDDYGICTSVSPQSMFDILYFTCMCQACLYIVSLVNIVHISNFTNKLPAKTVESAAICDNAPST